MKIGLNTIANNFLLCIWTFNSIDCLTIDPAAHPNIEDAAMQSHQKF